MNFKSLILFAGAVALATASSPAGEEDSTKLAQSQDEEESNQMAETACHPGPKRCAACASAVGKKNARAKAILSWRNRYNAANVRNYRAWLSKRAKMLKYYSKTYYYAHLKVLRSKQAYVNKRVAAALK
jgi:hypothetical protein